MKIALFIDADYNKPGGVQEYIRGLYDYLNKKGHKVTILTGKSKGKIKDKRNIIETGKSLPLKYPGTSASIALNWADQEEVDQLFTNHNFDILHLMAPFGLLGFQLLEKSTAKNVATYLITVEKSLHPLVLKKIHPLIKNRLEKLHGRLAVSDIAKDYAREMFPGKYTVIPLGIDTKRFNPKIKKIKAFQDRLNILFVGRLDKRKGLKYLLRAYKELSNTHQNLRLLIVGSGPTEKKLKNYSKKNKLKIVRFLGFIPDAQLNRYFASADIFCSPATENETFGGVILEATASGLPVVAFANQGYKNVFGELLKGFIVKNKSVDALVTALEIFIKNKNFRQETGRNNRKLTEELFAWEAVGERILTFYKSL